MATTFGRRANELQILCALSRKSRGAPSGIIKDSEFGSSTKNSLDDVRRALIDERTSREPLATGNNES
jgi:hypothetical protein